MKNGTLGQRLAWGFGICVALVVVLGGYTVYAVDRIARIEVEDLSNDYQAMVETERFRALERKRAAALRSMLLLDGADSLSTYEAAQRGVAGQLDTLGTYPSGEGKQLFTQIVEANSLYEQQAERVIRMQADGASIERLARFYEEDLRVANGRLDERVSVFQQHTQGKLEDARAAMGRTARSTMTLSALIALLAAVAASIVGFNLSRRIARDVADAITRIQSSSTELQAAANQQATNATEQATATAEVTSTLQELLTTSRQIADSANSVARFSEETAGAAADGEGTIARVQEALQIIRRQVDQVVEHMLDLGRKSQQVGGILEIINELTEQTNILAINATIEAAGAGEAGRRFTVVADEIRKLADRVTSSSREIRSLVEEMRAAANTTVMATEEGVKSVEAGNREFGEMSSTFKRIVDAVETTTEASREIELSTKQQTSAVEQVNGAIGEIAQGARENEAGSRQSLQMSSQLASLSRDLSRLIRSDGAA